MTPKRLMLLYEVVTGFRLSILITGVIQTLRHLTLQKKNDTKSVLLLNVLHLKDALIPGAILDGVLEQAHIKGIGSRGMYFSIPLYWKSEFVSDILTVESNLSGNKIDAFYGCFNDSPFMSGRTKLPHQDISMDEASEIIQRLHSADKQFFYLLNAPAVRAIGQEELSFLRSLLDLGCDAFVVSDIDLAESVRKNYPNAALHISTIADIDSPEKLEKWLFIEPKRVVLPHDTPKEPDKLEPFLKYLQAHEIKPEIMVTESCIFHCPYRSEHYLTLAKGENDKKFHDFCLKKRIEKQSFLFSPGSFIRPQDVTYYHSLYGVSNFKITGRSQTGEWLLKTVRAYIAGYFKGNLLDLMGMNPEIVPNTWFDMPEYALDDYLETLLKHKKSNLVLAEEYAAKQDIDMLIEDLKGMEKECMKCFQ
jgi:collagenase-like PrtC family protease